MAFVWEQRKFGSLLNEIREKTTIENEDTLLSCAIDGMYLNSELFSHFRGQSNIGYLKVKKNDLILSAQNLHLGNCNVNLRFEHGIISPAYKVYELVDCNPLFVQAWIKMDKTKDFFLKSSTEGASVCRKNILWEELYKQELVVPAIEEQTVIGTYFEQFDQLITLHQRKRMLRKCFFSIDWEQRKLGEVADIVGGGTPSTNVSNYWDGNIDWYAPAEISDQIFLSSSQRKITEKGYNNSSAKMLPIGTVLFTSRAGIGKTAILSKKGCTNQGFQSIVPHKDELDSYFIFSRTDELKRYGEIVGAGSTFVEVSGKQMANIEMMMPKTISEQKVIGAYFAKLDHLITLHQCKSNFCKKNEVNAWEQRKLGDVLETIKDGTHGTHQDANEGPLLLSAKNIRNGTIIWDESDRRISINEYEKIHSKFKLKKNDVLLTIVGSIGETAILKDISGITFQRSVAFLRTSEQITPEFLCSEIQTQQFQKKLNDRKSTSAQPGIYLGDLSEIPFVYSKNKDEQVKIGQYFSNLDKLITLHQWECNINENTEGNDEKQRKPIKKLIISEGNLSLVDDMFLLHRMTFLVCNKYILLRLNVVKYKITIIIISNILYSIVSLLIIACYLIVINKQLIILIYVEISVVIIKGDDDYARIRS